MRIWGRATIKLFSMKIVVEGVPPKPPFLIVSNHLSYIDIPIYSAFLDTTFVSKAEIKHWFIIGFMAKTLGIIFIDRRKKSDVKRVNQKISDDLNEFQGVVLFPEGTTSPGLEVMRFRPSLLEHAATSGMSVSYASIRYQTSEPDEHAYRSVCWWGKMSMARHLLLMGKNRQIDVTIRFGDKKILNNDRKMLAVQLHKKVSEIFDPVIDEISEEFNPLKI
jgi:1-acyl-sn-glycerol-3-phosphate acyltransferase